MSRRARHDPSTLIEHARASVSGPWMTQPRDGYIHESGVKDWQYPPPSARPADTPDTSAQLSWWTVGAMCAALILVPAAYAVAKAVGL